MFNRCGSNLYISSPFVALPALSLTLPARDMVTYDSTFTHGLEMLIAQLHDAIVKLAKEAFMPIPGAKKLTLMFDAQLSTSDGHSCQCYLKYTKTKMKFRTKMALVAVKLNARFQHRNSNLRNKADKGSSSCL
jgi:hypothetical protein